MLSRNADDFYRWFQRFDGQPNTRYQAAPTDRYDNRVQLRHLIQDLQTHGSLPSDNVPIVIPVDISELLLLSQFIGPLSGFRKAVARDHHFCAQPLAGGDLY